MKNAVLIIFVVILALVAIVLYKSAESLPKPFEMGVVPTVVEEEIDTEINTNTDNKHKKTFNCEPEQRGADECIALFKPVCAEISVQCVTTPCSPVKETFSNSCEACKNSLVDVYTEGECVIEN